MSSGRTKAPARGIAAVLILGALGGGLAYTKVTVDQADRTAPTTAWDSSDQGLPGTEGQDSGKHEGRRDAPLSKDLLPVPHDYRLGPDIEEFGNDVYLSAAKAEAWLGESEDGLPAEAVEEHRQLVAELDLQGLAMRSYAHARDNDLLVTIRLAQMRNKGAVKQRNAFRAQLTELLSDLHKGPEVEGHEDAACAVLPDLTAGGGEAGTQRVEDMLCTAYEDDTLVTLTASGRAPISGKAVAQLLEQQLDRLTEGGGISV